MNKINQQHLNWKIFNWILSDLLTSFACENRLANCFILCANSERESRRKKAEKNTTVVLITRVFLRVTTRYQQNKQKFVSTGLPVGFVLFGLHFGHSFILALSSGDFANYVCCLWIEFTACRRVERVCTVWQSFSQWKICKTK